GVHIALVLQKLHHGHVVIKGGCRAHDLVNVSWKAGHLFERFVEGLGGPKIMKRKDQSRSRPQLFELLRLRTNCSLELHIKQLTSGSCRFDKYLQLGSDRSLKPASTRLTATGAYHERLGVIFDKPLDPGNGRRGLREII